MAINIIKLKTQQTGQERNEINSAKNNPYQREYIMMLETQTTGILFCWSLDQKRSNSSNNNSNIIIVL